MIDFIFNPIKDKSPKGAVILNTEVKYTLRVSKFVNTDNAYFVMHKDGENSIRYAMTREYVDEKYIHFTFTCKFTEEGFFWYHFEIEQGDNTLKLIRSDNLDAIECRADSDYLQLVIKNESNADSSFRKGIIYHIFVDRFNKVGEVKPRSGLKLIKDWDTPVEPEFNENGERVNVNCYGGNFAGIIDKLPYLKELNVGTIYLSPIFEANSSHKYDVADYSKVDSMFGSSEDLLELIKKAKKLGIKIIIDGVFNHTGSDSVYFNKDGRYKTIGAYQSPNSKYYSWYDFNNYPNDYSCWWGVKTLPQTREDSGFFDYIAGKNGIIEKYMSMGLGGMRLDVVDELTNNFIHAICNAIRNIAPKALVVGEVWEDASSKISYDERKEYFLGGNLDSVTNYPMKNAILDFVKTGNVKNFVNTTNLILDQYPKSVQNNLMNILDTHDTIRALTYLGADFNNPYYSENGNYVLSKDEREKGIKLLKLASIIQYTIMGIPAVFYGDEVGIEGMKDPYCRTPYPWGKENTELLEWYKMLGNLRNNKVLDDGDMNIKYAENGILIYERVKKDNKIIIVVNRSGSDFEFVLERSMCNFFTGEYVSGKLIVENDNALILC
ncbi:MAG: glycoside hydrolase family 13 protein [Christensenellales bacterium]